ncbi:MAG: T9SS type A sorting domain-containing protein [Ignavibacteriae bacterium]|nr:T9SS type A sorting domain-containing protein [Ignavibacteriota bacterium]
MNKFKLFSIIVLVFIASYSFAQWAYVGGVTGAGNYPSISVVDPTTILVSGGNNTSGAPAIFRSTNGGVVFSNLPVTGIAFDLMCIWGITANIIYCGDGGGIGGAGGNAKVYFTSNGGTNWATVFSTGGTGGFFNGIVFSKTSPTSGFAISDPPTGAGGIYYTQRTTNGGTNWTQQSPPAVTGCFGAALSAFCIDDNFYGFGTSSPTVFTQAARLCVYTTNGGTTWNNAQLLGTASSTTQSFISTVAFNTNKINGLAASSPSTTTISRTTNGGSVWFSQTIPSTVAAANIQIKYVPNSNTAYLIASSGTAAQSFKTTDNGATWTALTWVTGVFACTHMELVYVGGSAYIYAVCNDGSVVKLVQTVTGVNEPQTSIPNDYKLEQNYPNPFNPTTTIDYSIPKASFVTLKVYDVLGNEVMTVVNEQQSANNYTYNVDFSKLSSGVYYYTLNTGNYTATKKLTLVK